MCEGKVEIFSGGMNDERFVLIMLKVHKIENFFGSELEFYTISLLVMLKY